MLQLNLNVFLGALVALVARGAMVYAESEGDAMPGREQGLWQTLIMLGIALVFFYLILWRPEQKRRQQQETVRSSLKKGDRVVAAMGIIGTVHKINDRTVVLKMTDGNSHIEVVKAAISEVVSDEAELPKETAK